MDQSTTDSWLASNRARSLLALVMAAEAGACDEVPVGALLAEPQGRIIAAAGNRCVIASDPIGHAEIGALRLGAARINNYRLIDAQLTVTLEPCPLCLEAAAMARLAPIQYAALRELPSKPIQPSRMLQQNLEHAHAAGAVLQFFFAQKREVLSSERKSVLLCKSKGEE
ncbi:MAG: nucleoside deaminase [Magnetococcales bacterium]|nr:nucleoside deaminase [Magnetococcales bacterium]